MKLTTVLAFSLSFGLAAAALAREPVKMQSEDDELIFKAFLKHTDANVARVTPEAVAKIDQPEDICWTWSQYLRMPLAAYHLTGDAKHLDSFVKAMDAMLTRLRKAPDGYLGFRGLPLPLFRDKNNPTAEVEVDIAELTIAHLMCDFAELVNAEAPLKQKHGAKVAQYLDLAENHLAGKKWEERKRYVDLGPKGAIIRMPAECGNNRDSLTNPHNKHSKYCRAFLALYHATGKDEYFRKAVKFGVRFKHTLRLDGDRYAWNYWDPAGDWDRKKDNPQEWKHWIGPEHRGGYHALTVAFAEALYDHGVIFDRTDMQRFVNTQMQVCWNGSLDAPEFRNTGGKPIKEAGYGTVMAPSLARFEPKIWAFCYGEHAARQRADKKKLDHGWQGGVNAIDYLVGKYLGPRTPEPTHAKHRDQFCQKPENAAFLTQVGFQVKP